MSSILRDIRYAFRGIRKAPGFTVAVVLTLAVGIGANTAIFSVIHTVLLRPFPFGEPDRLAIAWEVTPPPADGPMFLSRPNYVDWRDSNHSFEQLAAFAHATFFLATDDGTVRLDGSWITANLLETLRVSPELGRGFRPSDDVEGAAPVALISHALWRRSFGADSAVVGRTIRIDDVAREIVGVMPAEFDFPPPIDLEGNTHPGANDIWLPYAPDRSGADRTAHFLSGVGRLARGATFASANADMNALAAELARRYPASNDGWTARIMPMNDVVLGNLRTELLVLLAAVTAVLLIACVNVANLLLSRATGRQRDYAIRAALGARRPRLLSQALAESQILALTGGIAGTALAWIGTRILIDIAPANVPRLDQAGIDLVVIAWALGLSIITGLLFGLAPALRSFTPDLAHWLREGGRSGIGDGQGRLRDALVVAEVALSLLLLTGAGLLFRSFLQLRGIDPGFRAEHVLTMRVTLPRSYDQRDARAAAFRDIENRVRAVPGVDAAGLSLDVPLATDFQGTTLVIEGEPPPPKGTNLVNFTYVTPGWFDAIGTPVVAGRAIDNTDVSGAEPTAVVNKAAALAYFGGKDPIGRRVLYDVPRRIVGVVGDVHLESMADDPRPAIYFPYHQLPQDRAMSLVLRARTDAVALATAVRDRVREVDAGIPINDVRSMDSIVEESLASPRFASALLLTFSLVALFLAAIGLYGVISYSTSRRVREIGVRMALGARPVDAMQLVIRHALALTLVGVAAGIAAAVVFTRFLNSLLFGVKSTDPVTLAVVSLVLVAVAVVAGGIPAWRASNVDPVEALRHQ